VFIVRERRARREEEDREQTPNKGFVIKGTELTCTGTRVATLLAAPPDI